MISKSTEPRLLRNVRARNPERYLELATKLLPLIVQLNPAGSDFSGCNSMQDIGTKLLLSVGITDPTDEQIASAIKANDDFIQRHRGSQHLRRWTSGSRIDGNAAAISASKPPPLSEFRATAHN
jgi:hypothetical protein